MPTDTVRQFDDYIARLNALPEQIDQLIETSRAGLKAGLMPPKFLLEKVATQCRSIAAPAGIASPFAAPLQKFPNSIPAAEQARLKAAAIAAIDDKVRPAYQRLAAFVARDYAPKGRIEPGLWSLPNGDAKTAVIVKQVEDYREKEAAAAGYTQGTPDGKRPGQIEVNTGDFEHRSLLTIESTAYHEGSPGHHLQISIAQTLPELPPFRQQGDYTAYAEGWALYAERLGKDIGFYQEPLSDYGRLVDELLRANRLVLDTGVHYKHWTRQQMVNWFHAHSSDDEPDLQSETDRYIAWPAQALAYKLGQLRILALRDEARAALGDRFDIRAFHDTVLGGGALPLDALSERVRAWIAASKQGVN